MDRILVGPVLHLRAVCITAFVHQFRTVPLRYRARMYWVNKLIKGYHLQRLFPNLPGVLCHGPGYLAPRIFSLGCGLYSVANEFNASSVNSLGSQDSPWFYTQLNNFQLSVAMPKWLTAFLEGTAACSQCIMLERLPCYRNMRAWHKTAMILLKCFPHCYFCFPLT